MSKSELVVAMAEESGLFKNVAEAALNAFADAIADVLKKGDKITLVGLGTFEVRERSAREGRNSQTSATIKIAASKIPAFKAGKALKDVVK